MKVEQKLLSKHTKKLFNIKLNYGAFLNLQHPDTF